MLVSLLFFLIPAVMVFCALDHRFGWSPVPAVVSLIGDLLVVAGLALSMAVVMQNRYAGGNIAVATGQKVISTGLYRVVRHPMYAGALIITIGTPLALDSWWGLASLIPTLAILVVRILDEEKALADELDGYREYLHRTRFRVVPYIW